MASEPFVASDALFKEALLNAEVFLKACRLAAVKIMESRAPDPVGPLPAGADVVERTVISVAMQALWQAEGGSGAVGPFNFIDGIAHGMAAVLAQQPGEGGRAAADAACQVLGDNTRGYMQRTRNVIAKGWPRGN